VSDGTDPVVPDPFVAVEGCFNFRDAGGWPTTDGGEMRRRWWYRSDDPLRITPAGRRTVESLGLVVVVDLRQAHHVARSPGFLPPERTVHMSLVDRVVDPENPPRLETPTDITDLYDGMLERSREQLRQAIGALAEALTNGPTLVHCAFGKDRAGLATALVQAAIGVTEASIVADYARSDAPTLRRRAHMMEQPMEGDPPFATLPDNLFTAPAATMEALLRRARTRHGSLTAWAGTFLDPDTVTTLRRELVLGP
jgi:protein-tyrosine phosphatase